MLTKFTSFISADSEQAHQYGLRYVKENYPTYSRLKVGASPHGIELLLKLSDCLPPPFYCLYVLVISRQASEDGRYQSPTLLERGELVDFLLDYQELFESDGRHHVWVSAPDAGATLVYDKHNVIYAYGFEEEFEAALQAMGYVEEAFDIPYPHGHYYHAENDAAVEKLLHYWEWEHFPLQEVDEE